jgi:hypothetical protein
MKTIHCEIFTLDSQGRRQNIITPMVAPLPDKMTENEAARFILVAAAEQVGSRRSEARIHLPTHKATARLRNPEAKKEKGIRRLRR